MDLTSQEFLNQPSLIWNGRTKKEDASLLLALCRKFVVGSEEHKAKCANKIHKHILKKAWRNTYTNRTFIFSIYYARNIKIIDISYGLHAQAIDALYFLSSRIPTNDFSAKVGGLYESIYGRKLDTLITQTSRVLRNNIMHTGSITGIADAMTAQDKQLLTDFHEKYAPNNQEVSDLQLLIGFAAALNSLVEEIMLRILGLEDDDLAFNLLPASRLHYFYQP